jgi:hypothetical protein
MSKASLFQQVVINDQKSFKRFMEIMQSGPSDYCKNLPPMDKNTLGNVADYAEIMRKNAKN